MFWFDLPVRKCPGNEKARPGEPERLAAISVSIPLRAGCVRFPLHART
jgi:hypothetical protein